MGDRRNTKDLCFQGSLQYLRSGSTGHPEQEAELSVRQHSCILAVFKLARPTVPEAGVAFQGSNIPAKPYTIW